VSDEVTYTPSIPKLDLSEGTEMLEEFSSEAFDHLAHAEEAIIVLEKDPSDKDAIGAIFRAFHTIKGLASFLDLQDIRELAHVSETMLDMVRKDALRFEGDVTEATLRSIDGLRHLLELLQEQVSHGGELQGEYFDIRPQLAVLKGFIGGKSPAAPKKKIGEILIDEGSINDVELDEALSRQKQTGQRVGEILMETHAASRKDVQRAVKIQKGTMEASVKIRVDKLDALIDLVGELVISETQVVQNQNIHTINDQKLIKDITDLDRITRVLQEVAMGMRLVPVRATFQKMIRIIRDVAKKANKEVDVQLSGEDTEIDKNMVEMVSDPLVHMVRNSVDHGIEDRETRQARGKPLKGTIKLSAFHKGGNVVIEIRDDGAGLNTKKIFQKAVEKGLVNASDELRPHQICQLIFEPGFSTADKVTDISGRGVGMDVVKKNIERLRGKIDIDTVEGEGSVFSIQLPLTLAIIEGIILVVANRRFILPITSVIEFVQPLSKHRIDMAGMGEAYRVHGKVYPLVKLEEYFGVPFEAGPFEKRVICLVDSEYGRACFLVDDLVGQQQVVIKGLGSGFKHVRGVSGGAILGDGKVGLILDVNGIIGNIQQPDLLAR